MNLSNIPKEQCVYVNWENKHLREGEEDIFEICWCPSKVESSRYLITFEDFKKIRRDVPVVFKTIMPTVSIILSLLYKIIPMIHIISPLFIFYFSQHNCC